MDGDGGMGVAAGHDTATAGSSRFGPDAGRVGECLSAALKHAEQINK